MDAQEVMRRLNAITKAELELNWHLSETARAILNDSNKGALHNRLAKSLEDDLNKDIREGYVAKVSFLGTLTIFKKEKGGALLEVKRIQSNNAKMLPFDYIMGRKLSKRDYERVLETLE